MNRPTLNLDRPSLNLPAEPALGAPVDGIVAVPASLASAPVWTVEGARAEAAREAGLLPSAAMASAAALRAALDGAASEAEAEVVARRAGETLWQAAAECASESATAGGPGSDDRQLYWTRLLLASTLCGWCTARAPGAEGGDTPPSPHQARLPALFEQASRGMGSAAFPLSAAGQKRILISGFDPFGFPNGADIRQGNLSGAIALALHRQTLEHGPHRATVVSVVFPVRYADFDQGIAENHLLPFLSGPNPPHLVLSISQGRTEFEFEESAGRRRSAETFADNQGMLSGGSHANPVEPGGIAHGPEFIGHSVPAPALAGMRAAEGRSGPLVSETQVMDLDPATGLPRELPDGPRAAHGLAVAGTGGGFLSNEIYYRNGLLRARLGAGVPVMHLHTPKLAPEAGDGERNALIARARAILVAALPHL